MAAAADLLMSGCQDMAIKPESFDGVGFLGLFSVAQI